MIVHSTNAIGLWLDVLSVKDTINPKFGLVMVTSGIILNLVSLNLLCVQLGFRIGQVANQTVCDLSDSASQAERAE